LYFFTRVFLFRFFPFQFINISNIKMLDFSRFFKINVGGDSNLKIDVEIKEFSFEIYFQFGFYCQFPFIWWIVWLKNLLLKIWMVGRSIDFRNTWMFWWFLEGIC
jgi:hypothetical protein